MRIPPYYQNPGWQRFLAGTAIGAIVSWLVFIFMYGVLQERQINLIIAQQSKISDLEKYRDTLIEDYEKLNEDNKSKLKIQDFKIELLNYKQYTLDSFIVHNITNSVKKDLNHLIAKDIESVSNNKELLIKVIENRNIELDNKKYRLHVFSIYFDTTLEIALKIELVR